VLFGVVVVVDLVVVVVLLGNVVVVLVAEGTTVVVELDGDDVVGPPATVPEFPVALEPPDELAVGVPEVTRVVVVIDVTEGPLEVPAGAPGSPSDDCDVG
jgi:hypothetical protein